MQGLVHLYLYILVYSRASSLVRTGPGVRRTVLPPSGSVRVYTYDTVHTSRRKPTPDRPGYIHTPAFCAFLHVALCLHGTGGPPVFGLAEMANYTLVSQFSCRRNTTSWRTDLPHPVYM